MKRIDFDNCDAGNDHDDYENDNGRGDDDESDAWISNFLTVCSDWMSGQWDTEGGEREKAQVCLKKAGTCNIDRNRQIQGKSILEYKRKIDMVLKISAVKCQ